MPNQQLMDFIKGSRDAGQTDEQIKLTLRQNGWQDSVIQEAFLSPAPQAPQMQVPQQQSSYPSVSAMPAAAPIATISEQKRSRGGKFALLLIFLVVLGGVVYAGYYFFFTPALTPSTAVLTAPLPEAATSTTSGQQATTTSLVVTAAPQPASSEPVKAASSSSALPSIATSTPMATIDQGSLTSSFANATITGTAIGVKSVDVSAYYKNGTIASSPVGGPHNVVNGKWSATLTALPVGTYTVNVLNADTFPSVTRPLASGQLTITGTKVAIPVTAATKTAVKNGIASERAVYTSGNATQIRQYFQIPSTVSDSDILKLAPQLAANLATDDQLNSASAQWDQSSPTDLQVTITNSSGTKVFVFKNINGTWY